MTAEASIYEKSRTSVGIISLCVVLLFSFFILASRVHVCVWFYPKSLEALRLYLEHCLGQA